VPRWGKLRLNQIQPKAIEDGLHSTLNSRWTMHGVRAIMSLIFYHAEGDGLWRKESAARLARRNSERSIRITNARYSP
jgi:hypothetical protein